MRTRLYRIALLCMLTLGISLPRVALAQADEEPVIREITFVGLKHLSDEVRQQVRAVVQSAIDAPYDEEQVVEDTEHLLETGWFYRVRPVWQPTTGLLAFNVTEWGIAAKVEFVGNEIYPAEKLSTLVKTAPGQALNNNRLRQDALDLKEMYEKAGYILAVVDPVVTEDGTIRFDIFEPKIGEVRIEGNRRTRPSVIHRALKFKPGDYFNVVAVRDSLRALESLGIFESVAAVPEPGVDPGALTVALRVKEQRTGMLAMGVGHSNIQGIIGYFDVTENNLLGTGQSLSARVQFGADDSYNLSYRNPWIDSKRTSMTVNLYDRSILRQAVGSSETTVYNEQRQGANVSFSRPLDQRMKTRGSITFRADKISASDDAPPILQAGSNVRSVALAAVRDTRDQYYNATSGSYLSAGTEFAGFGAANFTKFSAEARRYMVVKRGKAADTEMRDPQHWVFATRLSAGVISGNSPFLDQFNLGGADTLRGYEEDAFPGENMILWNNELRVPLNESLQAVAFVDIGDAWGGQFADEFGDTSFKLHTGYGLGVRIQTPIGPLRLDYGMNGKGDNQFHFGIGASF